jgi:predicted RNase H-like nuclease (RuvC/YqgF family)
MEIILPIISALLVGTTIWQVLFFRKTKRKEESYTRVSESQADREAFANFRDEVQYFKNEYKEAIRDNIELTNENATLQSKVFSLEQKIKADQYRFSEFERKLRGMQDVVNNSIAKYNEVIDRFKRMESRAMFAEGMICLYEDCERRQPKRGEYAHK